MSSSARRPLVGWDTDRAINWQHCDELTGPITVDACVVGLGGSGLAAIGELLGRRLSVVGIDAGRIAGQAAGRNGGFLLGGAARSVHDLAAVVGADAAVQFYCDTLDEIDHLATLLGDDVIRRLGSIRLAGLPGSDGGLPGSGGGLPGPDGGPVDREAEQADCDRQFEFMQANGLPVRRYEGELGTGLYFPADAAMNPVRRAMGLAALYGGSARLFERTPATGITAGRVDTPAGPISAGIIIVAVDGGLELLLPQLAGRVRTARLQMACTAPLPPGILPCPVYANFGYDYLQQDDFGRIFAGGGRDRFREQEWTTKTDPTPAVQGWIDSLIDRVSGGAGRVTHRWAASVGYTPDSRPLVTKIDDGVVACGGYCGTGNLVGPIAARAAVRLAVDATPPAEFFAS